MTPARTVPVRRVSFQYPGPDGAFPKHFANDDLIMSHVAMIASSTFPEGEDFFVRSVRNYRDRITDPELRKQVSGFIGQESIHGREHREWNDKLAAHGYASRLIDRGTKVGLAVLAKVAPKRHQLAVTAALEHYTATLAYIILSDPDAQALIDHPEVGNLWKWHALEENEHKAVAFDVYQHVCGKQHLRKRIMFTASVAILVGLTVGTVLSLATDRRTYRRGELSKSFRRLRSSPFATREVADMLRDYFRTDFHPDDHDTTDLLEHWRAELFGPQTGALNDRLPVRAA